MKIQMCDIYLFYEEMEPLKDTLPFINILSLISFSEIECLENISASKNS